MKKCKKWLIEKKTIKKKERGFREGENKNVLGKSAFYGRCIRAVREGCRLIETSARGYMFEMSSARLGIPFLWEIVEIIRIKIVINECKTKHKTFVAGLYESDT